jgi:hypothetical protein
MSTLVPWTGPRYRAGSGQNDPRKGDSRVTTGVLPAETAGLPRYPPGEPP